MTVENVSERQFGPDANANEGNGMGGTDTQGQGQKEIPETEQKEKDTEKGGEREGKDALIDIIRRRIIRRVARQSVLYVRALIHPDVVDPHLTWEDEMLVIRGLERSYK